MQPANAIETKLTRIAIFYDGTFFWRISHYYKHSHPRLAFIDLAGFHDYIRDRVAAFETGKNVSLCQIVEAHFFRGRFSLNAAKAAKDPKALETDRLQDQILMYAGVVAHYYPMNEHVDPPVEKGIDVWLALEAYDLAVHKRFDVLVIVAGDQDFVPLVRKVNGLGTRVLVVGMDVDYLDQQKKPRAIKTSGWLLKEASYNVMFSEEVNSKTARGDRVLDAAFRPTTNSP